MHRINTRVALLGGLLALLAAAAVLLSSLGGGPDAQAAGSTPTNTPGPTPTPKPTDQTGEVNGVYDIIVDNGNPTVDVYHCLAFLAHDGATDDVKIAAQCYDNTGAAGDPNAEPLNDAPGEGSSGAPLGVGPPPPPPYNTNAPFKGIGDYDSGTDTLTISACIPEVGGIQAPNSFAVFTVLDATGDLSTDGKMTSSVLIYGNQTDANCTAGTPAGATPAPILATLYPATELAGCPADPPGPDTAGCVQAPYRLNGNVLHGYPDWDGDGCTDKQELDKTVSAKCGDDPFNPNDTSLTDTDVAGDYTLLGTAADEDCNPALGGDLTVCEMPGERVPGIYYSCVAYIAPPAALLSCYLDSPAFVVNPQTVPSPNLNATTCPPAPAAYCGNGSPGSAPPGITVPLGTVRNFGDIDTAIPVFTSAVDTAKNAVIIQGCFADLDGHSGIGNAYATATINMHTGHGWIFIHQGIIDAADCNDGPPFDEGIEGYVPVDMVRQTKNAVKRDSDSDGCADRNELTNTVGTGGLRDPLNHYDYFNPDKGAGSEHIQRVSDILVVVGQYHQDDVGAPDMKSPTDRTAIAGGNPWNLGPPDGIQRVDDILAAVKQYHHDC